MKSDSVWSVSLWVSGASLGAGLLALPIQTGLAGLIPALSGLVFIWALMLGSGLILAEFFVDMDQPSAGLFTVFEQGLGRWSRWLVTPGFLLLFYGVLVAYLSGSGAVLASLLHLPKLEWLLLLLFFLISTGSVLVGLGFIHRANMGFMILLLGSFVVMLLLVGKHIENKNLVYQDWKFLPSALPIILCSFAYQSIIPSVCTSLHNDRVQIRRALIFGTLLSLLVNGLWILVVVGVLPLDGEGSLLNAFHQNQPATIPLAQSIPTGDIQFFSLFFSLAALFTSYVAVGEGLRNFLADLLGNVQNKDNRRWLAAGLTFIPPLLITLVYPQLFLKVLNLVGGLAVALLFGLLPAIILFYQARKKKQKWQQTIALLLCMIFALLLLLECGQEAGLLQIHPQIEYMWHGPIQPGDT